MDQQTQDKISRLQNSLSTLRKVAGWSAEELGELLDVTRQTIVNLETGQTKMTKIQYMAIRLTFEVEAQGCNHETLSNLITILVDSEDLDCERRAVLKETVDTAASSVGRRAGANAAGKAAATAAASALATSAFLALAPASLAAGPIATGIIGSTASAMSLLFDVKKGKRAK